MLEIPETLEDPHPFVGRTAEALGADPYTTPDGRIQAVPEPGLFEVKVAPAMLGLTLRMLQAIVDASLKRGLAIAPVTRKRGHRAGVGIGQEGNLAAIWAEERRRLVAASDAALEDWRSANPRWLIREEDYVRRGWIPQGTGSLRIRLSPRHDWPSISGSGWRRSFSDQVGRPLVEQLDIVVDQLEARAKAGG
jgi:hypothetical protein